MSVTSFLVWYSFDQCDIPVWSYQSMAYIFMVASEWSHQNLICIFFSLQQYRWNNPLQVTIHQHNETRLDNSVNSRQVAGRAETINDDCQCKWIDKCECSHSGPRFAAYWRCFRSTQHLRHSSNFSWMRTRLGCISQHFESRFQTLTLYKGMICLKVYICCSGDICVWCFIAQSRRGHSD